MSASSPVVVLDQRCTEPVVVRGQGCLVRLLVGEGGIGAGLFGHAEQGEVELDGDRLLRPQGAVVVERGDPLGFGTKRSEPSVVTASTNSMIVRRVGLSAQDERSASPAMSAHLEEVMSGGHGCPWR
jgi:hypothetical protein